MTSNYVGQENCDMTFSYCPMPNRGTCTRKFSYSIPHISEWKWKAGNVEVSITCYFITASVLWSLSESCSSDLIRKWLGCLQGLDLIPGG